MPGQARSASSRSLCRASTFGFSEKDVDGRDKPGHDEQTAGNGTDFRVSIQPRADPREHAKIGLGLNAVVLVDDRHADGDEAREAIEAHAHAG